MEEFDTLLHNMNVVNLLERIVMNGYPIDFSKATLWNITKTIDMSAKLLK